MLDHLGRGIWNRDGDAGSRLKQQFNGFLSSIEKPEQSQNEGSKTAWTTGGALFKNCNYRDEDKSSDVMIIQRKYKNFQFTTWIFDPG